MGVVGLAVAAVAVLAVSGLRRSNRQELCLWNLSRIGMSIVAAESHAAGWERIGTGRRFFLEADRWPGVRPFPMESHWFCCPEVGPPEEGRIDYRGPAASLGRLDRDDPVAADRPGNHPRGGNVVLRGGGVKSATDTDPAWLRAASTTTDRAE